MRILNLFSREEQLKCSALGRFCEMTELILVTIISQARLILISLQITFSPPHICLHVHKFRKSTIELWPPGAKNILYILSDYKIYVRKKTNPFIPYFFSS